MKRWMWGVALLAAIASACSDDGGSAVTTVTTATTTATTTTSTSLATTVPAPSTTTEPVTVDLPTLVVGTDVEYRGSGPEIELTGPTLLIVTDDGTIHIGDPVGNRILSFGADGQSSIDLASRDIINAAFIGAWGDDLAVVEISFAPVRNRIHRVTQEGEILATGELPLGARLENGMSGVIVDDAGRVALMFEGGANFGFFDWETGTVDMNATIEKAGITVGEDGDDYRIAGTLVTADLGGRFGGLRLLDVVGDTVLLIREEVAEFTPITVLATVESYDLSGSFLGSVRIPLQRQVVAGAPGLAVTPAGEVLVLLSGEDMVVVEKLVPGSRRITIDG